MKLRVLSLVLLLLSLLFLVGMTLFESALINTPTNVERALTFLLLVLPAGTGAVVAGLSMKHRERLAWQSLTLLVLNALFAIFFMMVVLIAG